MFIYVYVHFFGTLRKLLTLHIGRAIGLSNAYM